MPVINETAVGDTPQFDLNNPRNTNCPVCSGEVMEGDVLQDSGKTLQMYICVKCGWNALKCEIWTRVVGYLRPVASFNKGKKEEFKERKTYKVVDNEKKEC